MASYEGQRSAEQSEAAAPRPKRSSRAANGASGRRRARLARGPLVIGDPALAIDVLLPPGDPYRADTLADGGRAFGLELRAASVRGMLKRYTGTPRQDDICLRLHEPTRTLIAAVADGVSDVPRADMAAALAARQAAAVVAHQLDGGAGELDWRDVFDQAAWALIEEHRRHSGDQEAGVEEAVGSLATTLVVAAVTAEDGSARVQLAAAGDSPGLMLRGDQFRVVMAEPEDGDGLLGGGVQALPRIPRGPVQSSCTLEPGEMLLLCTDGLAVPLGDGRGEVGRVLARELARPPDPIDFARLLDFSRATYDDDRSLVAVWMAK
jgi:serine/threonine protein phosphatase PrpC